MYIAYSVSQEHALARVAGEKYTLIFSNKFQIYGHLQGNHWKREWDVIGLIAV